MTNPSSMAQPAKVAIAVVAPAAIVTLTLLVAPWVPVSIAEAEALTFVGAASLGIVGVVIGTRTPLSGRATAVVAVSCAVLLAVVALSRARSPWLVPVVDACLIAIAWTIGGAVGSRIEHPGHLLPAAAVAAAADVVSVASSWGPSHAIAESERALAVLAINFPVAGTRIVAPALGVGDLVFVALLLAAAGRHGLSRNTVGWLSWFGVLAAGLAAALSRRAIPALPAVGALVIAFVPEARRVARKDRAVATIAIGVSIVAAAAAVLGAVRGTS